MLGMVKYSEMQLDKSKGMMGEKSCVPKKVMSRIIFYITMEYFHFNKRLPFRR